MVIMIITYANVLYRCVNVRLARIAEVRVGFPRDEKWSRESNSRSAREPRGQGKTKRDNKKWIVIRKKTAYRLFENVALDWNRYNFDKFQAHVRLLVTTKGNVIVIVTVDAADVSIFFYTIDIYVKIETHSSKLRRF